MSNFNTFFTSSRYALPTQLRGATAKTYKNHDDDNYRIWYGYYANNHGWNGTYAEHWTNGDDAEYDTSKPSAAHGYGKHSTTLAPAPRHQRLTTVCGWCDAIIQPFFSRFLSRCFCFQTFLWHKNVWTAKFGILDPKLATNTPQSGHRSAS